MGRDRHYLATRCRPELRARRGNLGCLQVLLDHASHVTKFREVGVRVLTGHGELEPTKRFGNGTRRHVGWIREQGVAFAREAVIQLDHGPPDARRAPAEVDQCVRDFRLRRQVLETHRHFHRGLAEHFPAA